MSNQLQKAINLARMTGDRLIVFDSSHPEDAYVVVPFDQYEEDFCESEELIEDLLDEYEDMDSDYRIEDDQDECYSLGGTKKVLTNEEQVDKINRDIDAWKNMEEINKIQENNSGIMNFEDGFSRERTKTKRGSWAIPRNIKEGANEIIEEDRQYLDEAPF